MYSMTVLSNVIEHFLFVKFHVQLTEHQSLMLSPLTESILDSNQQHYAV